MSPSLAPHPSFIAASQQNTICLHAFSQCLPNLRFFGNANLKGEISLPMLRIITLFGPQISPFQAHRILKGRLVGHKPISLKTSKSQTNKPKLPSHHPIIPSKPQNLLKEFVRALMLSRILVLPWIQQSNTWQTAEKSNVNGCETTPASWYDPVTDSRWPGFLRQIGWLGEITIFSASRRCRQLPSSWNREAASCRTHTKCCKIKCTKSWIQKMIQYLCICIMNLSADCQNLPAISRKDWNFLENPQAVVLFCFQYQGFRDKRHCQFGCLAS